MKKAFDQNVSRAKPRVRLGAVIAELAETLPEAAEPVPEPSLADEVKARAERVQQPRPTATEALQVALGAAVTEAKLAPPEPVVSAPVAQMEPPAPAVEIQNPRPPMPEREAVELDPHQRRERLKERLKAVRENPRPEPLPASVAQAGALAVERIAHLQGELNKVKAQNLSLTQELESARRQAERATEEARARMDEARRLAAEMDGRVKLLADLEKELAALEGERDEALLALQDSRLMMEAGRREVDGLKGEIAKRDQSLAESLAEEERLASELEAAKDESTSLRKAVDALTQERDTLARQVADLTTERAELLEARKALEAVHRALTQAASR